MRANWLSIPLFLALAAVPGCGPADEPAGQTVGESLSQAQAPDGQFISWREHIIDDLEMGGVPISGSDGLEVMDLDLDGHEDIVSVHESDTQYDGVADGHIRLAFGSEDPKNWTLATLAEGPEAGAAEDVSIADVNGDGYPDIIAACEFEHLIYFQNPGKDARSKHWERLIPSVASGRGSFIRVFFADFNGDGRPEVVAPNKGSQRGDRNETTLRPISWYGISGDPLDDTSWTEHELARVAVPINSRPVDLDSDGDLDVLASSRAEARLFWFENVGSKEIEFREHPIEIAVPESYGPTRMTGFMFAFHDFNADSRLDVLLSEGGSNVVWLEHPEEVTMPWQLHWLGTMEPDSATGLTITDIDGDGHQDVFCGSYSQGPRDEDGIDVTVDRPLGRLAWFQNPGALDAFWKRHDISRRKRGMFDMTVPRDLDADGDIDLIGTRGNSLPYDGVYWLEQVRTPDAVQAFSRARETDSQEMPLP
ncbi:MAG: VCBS repeat-containing protein [Bryobacterales bacterium]|nr:VCBS repeat-containing protein [Bryobacterales bacterium]